MVNSFRDVVELWPTPDDLAADIRAGRWAVRKWRSRDAIPAEWWLPILQTEIAKQNCLTVDAFATFAARERMAS